MIDLGNTGYSYDIVNGLHKNPGGGGGGMPVGKMSNDERFQPKRVDRRNEKVFGILVAVDVVLFVLFRAWLLGLLLTAALVAWLWWSGDPASDKFLTTDPETGLMVPKDWDNQEMKYMIGYGNLFKPFIEQEEKFRRLVVSAKTLPPQLSDATCEWRCVQLDDAKIVFEMALGDVNGAVPFFTKMVKESAASFGDPDRHGFKKIGEANGRSLWEITYYPLPKDLTAGVSWS